VGILPAMSNQDPHRLPGGNMCRYALHRQGQNAYVSARCHAMAARSVTLVLPHRAGLGYRPTERNIPPSPDRPKGLLPALGDRVCTPGEIR
jgi:hypothetical protein